MGSPPWVYSYAGPTRPASDIPRGVSRRVVSPPKSGDRWTPVARPVIDLENPAIRNAPEVW